MTSLKLIGQHAIVLGMGDSGLSAARWLLAQHARVTVADTRSTPPNQAAFAALHVPLRLGEFTPATLADADFIVASPGVAIAHPAIAAAAAQGIPVVGDVELFAQHIHDWPSKVIAITGSNGKSTVTSLVGHLCERAGLRTVVAGNIGLPVLDALAAVDANALPDVFVLELSSFQLETTASLHCAAATVLNVSEDHLDRYSGMDAYTLAKARILAHADKWCLNLDDTRVKALQKASGTIWFTLSDIHGAHDFHLLSQETGDYLAKGGVPLFPLADLPLAGRHNAANALAALALVEASGIALERVLPELATFQGLAHRVEYVLDARGVTFYDDSKGTNVGATEAALLGFSSGSGKRPVLLIAGGDGKGQDFTPLNRAVAAACKAVFLIGRDAEAIAHALAGNGVPVSHYTTLEAATAAAFAAATRGEVVLLSPACASLDMFKNYAHRADVFIATAKQLAEAASEGGA